MIIKTSHRVLSIALACLMLMSTTTVAVDLHYCQDSLMGLSLFGTTESCHKAASKCGMHADIAQTDDGCCTNKHVVVESGDIESISPTVFQLTDAQLMLVVAFALTEAPIILDTAEDNYLLYEPPPPDQDIPVLYQSFLI